MNRQLIETLLTSIAVLLRIISNPVGNVFQKQLTSKGNHPLLINFLTYLLLSIACLGIVVGLDGQKLPGEFWLYSILAGIVGALGNGFLVKALEKGDLSVLGPVNSYKAIIGVLGGVFLLGEIPNVSGILGIVLIVYGSYFVLDTTEQGFSLELIKKTEIQFRIWAMILTAIEAVFLKKIILLSSTTIAFISWCCFGAVFSFLLLFVFSVKVRDETRKVSVRDFSKYLLLVVCIGTMQFTTNYTFAQMPVGYALSLFQLSIIASVLLGHKVFQEQDIRRKLLGSSIMVAGSVLIILLKNK